MSHEKKPERYEIHGTITFEESGQSAAGLRVVAMDADWTSKDDKLGEATTDEAGGFRITYGPSKFKELFERNPDIYLHVYDKDDHLLISTKESVVKEAEGPLEINLEVPGAGDVPAIRSQFTQLILGNPNYFGTLPELDLAPVFPMSGNKTYEEVTCLGFHPDLERLEAVVVIKRPYGYKTDPCGSGSIEYVRFFVEHGGVWEDLGVDSFKAYNMPDSDHPLCYTVSIPLDEPEKYCTIENLMNVRAILSWNQEPPAGNATWTPPWGNRLDATIQIDAWKIFTIPLGDLVAEGILEIEPPILAQLNLDEPLPAKKAEPLSYSALKELYAEAEDEQTKVPGHRFGFADALKLAAGPVTSDLIAQVTGDIPIAGPIGLVPGPELAEILDDLVLTVDNTNFEKLTCAGYNPHTREVGGVISIKRSTGYSGGLCTPGSTEYVGFWVEHGGAWHALGVAQVQVHDLAGAGGGNTVEYAVFRFTNAVPEFPCENLAGLRLRAILSWNTPPTDENFKPHWGNVIETHIQPPIGDPLEPGECNRTRLMRINRASIDGISSTTGRVTNTTPVAGDCGGVDRPFGGNLFIEGDFVNKPDVFHPLTGDVIGALPIRYQVFWHKDGSPAAPTQLTNSFMINVYPKDATLSVTKTQSVTPYAGQEYYTYMESGTQAVNPRMLAVWQAGGLEDGRYTLRVEAIAPCKVGPGPVEYVNLPSVVQKVYIYNGFPHLEPVLQPDGTVALVPQKRPELTLTMGGPASDCPGVTGECADVTVGDIVCGTYRVRDNFFGSLRVRMVPVTIGGVTHVKPVTITNPGSVTPHLGVNPTVQVENGKWELDTSGLPACGYNIELSSWDRALVGNSCSGHYNRLAVGFCLRAPEE